MLANTTIAQLSPYAPRDGEGTTMPGQLIIMLLTFEQRGVTPVPYCDPACTAHHVVRDSPAWAVESPRPRDA